MDNCSINLESLRMTKQSQFCTLFYIGALKKTVSIAFLVLISCGIPFILNHYYAIPWHTVHTVVKFSTSHKVMLSSNNAFLISFLLLDGVFFNNDDIDSVPSIFRSVEIWRLGWPVYLIRDLSKK